ncbi:MAG: tRNA (N(6)-L-threonylcarbamoyladenosine(37)-C(2))-methylthiotransferase MtaB [Bacteroidales bacterium]|nr:tRNA (N(6)-L-threonylcarbamoyladenosine(37)-C(2))-methylthiotransferase MtaB [Bacteroidales bacterium]
MSRIAFVTLGCKLNYAETSTYERGLVAAGWEVVPWSDVSAEFFLVTTCSVTEHSDKKSRNIIRKLHRLCPDAGIVVTGCSAELRRSDIERLPGVLRVFGATEKSAVVPWLLSLAPDDSPGYFRAWSSGERTRSFLKVQDGCDYKCHYCTVPYARGESRNAPIAEVVEDARAIAAQGIKEIVITGVNTGDFGKSTGETFFELLKALDKVEGIERYRISSIEPNLLTEEIIDWIATGSKVLPHFHIPLQSGCDEILKAMGRRYLTADFARKIEYIRKALEKPGQQKVFFGIDVIVGFPGETDELFQQTYDFLKNVIKPAFIHIFPYSKRPGTPAAEMKNQVQDSVKTGRVERLEALCDELHTAFVAANKGCRSKVLFEQKTRDGMAEGWSENYIKVTRPWKEGIVNSIEEIEL